MLWPNVRFATPRRSHVILKLVEVSRISAIMRHIAMFEEANCIIAAPRAIGGLTCTCRAAAHAKNFSFKLTAHLV